MLVPAYSWLGLLELGSDISFTPDDCAGMTRSSWIRRWHLLCTRCNVWTAMTRSSWIRLWHFLHTMCNAYNLYCDSAERAHFIQSKCSVWRWRRNKRSFGRHVILFTSLQVVKFVCWFFRYWRVLYQLQRLFGVWLKYTVTWRVRETKWSSAGTVPSFTGKDLGKPRTAFAVGWWCNVKLNRNLYSSAEQPLLKLCPVRNPVYNSN